MENRVVSDISEEIKYAPTETVDLNESVKSFRREFVLRVGPMSTQLGGDGMLT